ncbi:unknown [Blautia hydrogenotrophica CAG:147]|nr:unknown [Blautia hydrogenotrophica CAG:147]
MDEISPKHGFQSASVGIDDRYDSHDDNQNVYIDVHQTRKYHTRQVHDDGHTSDLVNDKHDCAQNTQSFAVETQLQIMVSGVNIQLTVHWKEKFDGYRNSQQHAQLSKP